MISPHFVCLSMIVSGRYMSERETFAAVDGLAYAIERENEPESLPTIVQTSVDIFVRARQEPTK